MTGRSDSLKDVIAADAAERLIDEGADHGDLLPWLRRSPLHVGEYLAMAGLSADVARAAAHIDIPVEELVADARDSHTVVEMGLRDLRAGGSGIPAAFGWRAKLAGAAAGLAISACVVAGIALLSGAPHQRNPNAYTTAHGEERTVRLADGSFVHINTDTTLDVNFTANIRSIELERGEAYFEVAKDAARPFRVRSGASVLQDIGTAFDVFRRNDGTVVTVAEGRVRIFNNAVTKASASTPLADLRAGEQTTISRSGAVGARTHPDLNEALAWTRQQIVFDGEPVADVAAEFNRYNDIPITVHDPRISRVAISGTFDSHGEKSFVAFLRNLRGVKVEERQGEIVIEARNPGKSGREP